MTRPEQSKPDGLAPPQRYGTPEVAHRDPDDPAVRVRRSDDRALRRGSRDPDAVHGSVLAGEPRLGRGSEPALLRLLGRAHARDLAP